MFGILFDSRRYPTMIEVRGPRFNSDPEGHLMSAEAESQAQAAVMEETEIATTVVPDESTEKETRTRKLPPYNVVILNDEVHTYDYVVEMLTKLFGHSLATALELTIRIDTTGRAVVYTTHKEKAELKRDQVLAYGPDPRMSVSKTSLACYIEPAPTG
jgi:ATP-dependent Clp protease adaptor protein ClpS